MIIPMKLSGESATSEPPAIKKPPIAHPQSGDIELGDFNVIIVETTTIKTIIPKPDRNIIPPKIVVIGLLLIFVVLKTVVFLITGGCITSGVAEICSSAMIIFVLN